MRRQLWETIVELAEAVMPLDDERAVVRVTALELDLPLEVAIGPSGVVAELPRWRLPTGFDLPRSRIRLTLHEVRDDG